MGFIAAIHIGPETETKRPARSLQAVVARGKQLWFDRTIANSALRVPMLIYKIVDRLSWEHAASAGSYLGSAHDVRDGFIHFSTAEQAAETAAKHFAGQGDLLLVAVEAENLGAALKWEPSRGGALFPHLYAPLPTARAQWVKPLPLGEDGRHVFPIEGLV